LAALTATVLLLAVALAGCGGDGGGSGSSGGSKAPTITIGTKNFTEQYILGELYRQALEAKGFHVDLKSDIGSSEIVDRALLAGSLDMYPEYTGVMLSELAGMHREPRSAAAAYQQAKAFQEKRGFTLLAMTPFSDSNAVAATHDFARQHGLHSIGDLSKIRGGAKIGAPPEFRTRFEGLIGMREVYGVSDATVEPYKIGEQYAALDRGRVGVAAVFTTDGQLVRGRYTVLSDPRRLFAFQNVAPVVKRSLVEKYPEIGQTVNAVSAKLTTDAMRKMNAAAVDQGKDPADVAHEFLVAQGLL
jgi:osmoprotectant transport system substrate-binding protein